MAEDGLAKLVEEIGELQQVAGKLLAYKELRKDSAGLHPDGTNLRERLQDEMADVLAAIEFVRAKLSLDEQQISTRKAEKVLRFEAWDTED